MDKFDKENGYKEINDLLDELYDIIDGYKVNSFFGAKGLDKDEIFEIIQEIRLSIPAEIKQAQSLVENSERIINDANNKALKIIQEAEITAEQLTSSHEIKKRAEEEAEQIITDAKNYLREMKNSANSYAENCLEKTAQAMQESLDVFVKQTLYTQQYLNDEIKIIYEHKQELADNN